MSAANWLQLVVLSWPSSSPRACSAATSPRLRGRARPGDRVFLPVERALYRACGVDAGARAALDRSTRSRCWPSAPSPCSASTACSASRAHFRSTRPDVAGVPPALAFNTAVSFVTNTNWQNYGGESTMSHLTQMAGSRCRTSSRPRSASRSRSRSSAGSPGGGRATIGNFWVDLTRAVTRILLPLAIVLALMLVEPGRRSRTSHGFTEAPTARRARRSRSRAGPFASQEAIKELGTNGGGTYNANSAHPFENPTAFTNLLEIFALLLIPFALTYAYGRLVGNTRQGWAVFAAMLRSSGSGARPRGRASSRTGNPRLEALGASAANMEGKEIALRRGRVRRSSRRRRRARRPAPSTARTTATRRSAAPCRSST